VRRADGQEEKKSDYTGLVDWVSEKFLNTQVQKGGSEKRHWKKKSLTPTKKSFPKFNLSGQHPRKGS